MLLVHAKIVLSDLASLVKLHLNKIQSQNVQGWKGPLWVI